MQCSCCKAVRYCGRKCQKRHWQEHKVLCAAINQLSSAEEEKCKRRCTFNNEQGKITELIGGRCMVDCFIGGRKARGLWDTGSQVSLLSANWLEDQGIEASEVRELGEILDRDIELEGVGGFNIPYTGYVMLSFASKSNEELLVPFLVTKEKITNPIIGYNVISQLIANQKNDGGAEDVLTALLKGNGKAQIPILLNTLRETPQEEEAISTVRTKKLRTTKKLKAGESARITCKVNRIIVEERTPVLFEPEITDVLPDGIHVESELVYLKKGANSRVTVTISNKSIKDLDVPSQMTIGEIHYVSSVTPVGVSLNEESRKEMEERRDSAKAASAKEIGVTEMKGSESEEGNKVSVEQQLPSDDDVKSAEPDGECTVDDEMWREKLQKFDLSTLTSEQKEQVRNLLWEERKSFATSSDDIGCAPELVMGLETVDEVPVQRNYNSIPRPLITKVKHHVEDMLNRQWISKSKSAWSSPVVIVRKKCGDIRLCCDFRNLNQKTVPDSHPLPRVQDTLDSLQGSKWFSVLDQTRAYYQGFIAEKDREKTAFVTPWGLYEWNRIPFGLRNAPAKFQRYMEGTVEDFRDEFALPYLDDIIVYSRTFEEHLGHLRTVLRRIRDRGLKLNLEKCDLFRKEVKFLGRIVNEHGYRIDVDKVKAVTELKDFVPKTASDIRHLMGLLGFHRRHIQDFSRRAKPITNLLLLDKDEVKKDQTKASKKRKVAWSGECREALSSLIDDITTAPILIYPNFEEEFIVHTDASLLGVGAILYQKHEGKMCVVAYASRTLNKAEAKYHPTKLEFLALKWAVSDAFRDYLGYSNHFWVFTDNNPLVYMMNSNKLNAFGERWLSELAEYNFTTKYRAGIINKDADCVSRLPLDIENYMVKCTEEIQPDAFRAIMAGVQLKQGRGETWRVVINALNADLPLLQMEEEPFKSLKENVNNIKKEQHQDKDIAAIIEAIKNNTIVKTASGDTKELKILKRGIKQLSLTEEDILVRKSKNVEQIVLPKSMRNLVYEKLHVEMGHLGVERVVDLAKDRVYWPQMAQDIEMFIKTKCVCLAQKRPHHDVRAPLGRVTTLMPMELVTIDFVHLEKGSGGYTGGYEYIMVIVDHFTRFAQAYPTKNKMATTAASRLYNDFLLRFGFPARILSDQGGEFQNKVIQQLNKLAGVEKSRTTPYHPQTNGLCERMNKTLLQMLRTLPEKMKSRWPESVNKMIHAYNSTRHSITGYSPYYLMFGREPRLPIDILLGLSQEKKRRTYGEFVKTWKSQMEEAYNIVREKTAARKEKDKRRWDAKYHLTALQEGDRVLVQNKEKGGPGKLRSFWEQSIYVIKQQKGNQGLVYEIQKEDGMGRKTRTVHRNMLLPIGEFVLEYEPEKGKEDKGKQKKVPKKLHVVENIPVSDDSSDVFPQAAPCDFSSMRQSAVPPTEVCERTPENPRAGEVSSCTTEESSMSEKEPGTSEDSSVLKESDRVVEDSIPVVEPSTAEEATDSNSTSSTADEQQTVEEEARSEEELVDLNSTSGTTDEQQAVVVDPSEEKELTEQDDAVGGQWTFEGAPSAEEELELDTSDGAYSAEESDFSETGEGVDDDELFSPRKITTSGASSTGFRTRTSLQQAIQASTDITPGTKSRCRRIDERYRCWRRQREEIRRGRRKNFDILSQESPVKVSGRPEENLGEGTSERLVEEERVRRLPRALRELADYNKPGLREAPLEKVSDPEESIADADDAEHDISDLKDEPSQEHDVSWSDPAAVYDDVGMEVKLRRGTRVRKLPSKFAESNECRVKRDEGIYYFAYGSNNNPSRMHDRGIAFKSRELGKLTGYVWKVNKQKVDGTGACNIEESLGSCVYGVLYRLHKIYLSELDRYEGVSGGHYFRKSVTIEKATGECVPAVTYVAQPHRCRDGLRADAEYLQHCLAGRDLLPVNFVEMMRRTAQVTSSPKEERVVRKVMKHNCCQQVSVVCNLAHV